MLRENQDKNLPSSHGSRLHFVPNVDYWVVCPEINWFPVAVKYNSEGLLLAFGLVSIRQNITSPGLGNGVGACM